MPPTINRSVQSWYTMLMSMLYSGIGYMATGQLCKEWLEEQYKTNTIVVKSWSQSGLITGEQLLEFMQLGEVINNFSPGILVPVSAVQ